MLKSIDNASLYTILVLFSVNYSLKYVYMILIALHKEFITLLELKKPREDNWVAT